MIYLFYRPNYLRRTLNTELVWTDAPQETNQALHDEYFYHPLPMELTQLDIITLKDDISAMFQGKCIQLEAHIDGTSPPSLQLDALAQLIVAQFVDAYALARNIPSTT